MGLSQDWASSIDLTPESVEFGRELFRRVPDLINFARLDPVVSEDGLALVISMPAPSGDPDLRVVVWMDEGSDPSLAIGGWHTHASVYEALAPDDDKPDTILGLIEAVLSDRVVSLQEVYRQGPGNWTIASATDDEELLDLVTDPNGSGTVRVRSWSGTLDRTLQA